MTQQQAGKNTFGKIPGIVLGLILIFVWTLLAVHIESSTVAGHQNVYANPLFAWINLGPVPLFIAAGFCYFMRSDLPAGKRRNDVAGIKGMIAGFFVWLAAILVILPPGNTNTLNIYPVIGGYLLMLVFAFAFQGKIRVSGD
ncbi:MAG: hypothetical protein WC342_07635 [Methanoregula sp.]|jgi:Na+/proline symporter